MFLDPIRLTLQGEGHYGLHLTEISVSPDYEGLGQQTISCQTKQFRLDCSTRQSGDLSLVGSH